ncbi:MAG TPA: hypothetical protein VHP11_09175, partial [Tepidisphaeraceae bacterium]|nr:hypothetical protein [Tepidisphaeraceae bacterium]
TMLRSAKPVPIVLATLMLSLLLLVGGCSSSATLRTWQDRVEEYVWDEANGDPNSLRDMTWADSQKGFAVLGNSDANVSTDTNGVLLAHREVAGRRWFIFLVGQVHKQVVQDIRLVAFSMDNGQFQWMLSEANSQALETYRQFRESDWKNLYPERQEPPAWYLRFPAEDDAFSISIDNSRVLAKHGQSGAQWILTLPQNPSPHLLSTDATSASFTPLNE